MRSFPESALSETVATTLIIILVVALVAVIAAIIMGVPLLPQQPTLAAFKADTVMGANRSDTSLYNVPVIRLYQMAGAPLTQQYTEGEHHVVNFTRVRLIDPAGKSLKIQTAISMRGMTIEKGEPFYIFYYNTGGSESPWIWMTNDANRVITGSGGGVQAFLPHGTWKVLVTDEKDTDMIIYQQDIRL